MPTDRRVVLLDAIAQASITIQRSVAELEQMGRFEPDHVVDARVCGVVAEMDGGMHAVCASPAGHEGKHASPLARWSDPPSAEQYYCGHVAQATGVEVKCDHPAGHVGPHRRGEMTWPNQHAVCQASTAAAGEAGTLWYCVLPAGHGGRHARGSAGW